MATYRSIGVRSPFYIQLATSEPTVYFELRIYYGDVVADRPAIATYTLEKEQLGGEATIEVAEIIRDYCSQTSAEDSGFVWVEVTMDDLVAIPTVATYLASEGYSLYMDGVQHNGQSYTNDFVALPNVYGQTKEHRVLTTEIIPSKFSALLQPQDGLNWKYRYKSRTTGTWTSYVLLAASTNHNEQYTVFTVNSDASEYEIYYNGTASRVVVDLAECNKYNTGILDSKFDQPAVLQYINKYGAKTWMPFSLKYMENINVESDSFQRNVMDYSGLSNSSGLHASRRRVTGTKQSFVLNSDWLNEYYTQIIEELLLSEYVWLNCQAISDNLIPVNIKTTSLEKKNHLNDKLINYTVNLESASEYINTVR